jgi:hypothetical protein
VSAKQHHPTQTNYSSHCLPAGRLSFRFRSRGGSEWFKLPQRHTSLPAAPTCPQIQPCLKAWWVKSCFACPGNLSAIRRSLTTRAGTHRRELLLILTGYRHRNSLHLSARSSTRRSNLAECMRWYRRSACKQSEQQSKTVARSQVMLRCRGWFPARKPCMRPAAIAHRAIAHRQALQVVRSAG